MSPKRRTRIYKVMTYMFHIGMTILFACIAFFLFLCSFFPFYCNSKMLNHFKLRTIVQYYTLSAILRTLSTSTSWVNKGPNLALQLHSCPKHHVSRCLMLRVYLHMTKDTCLVFSLSPVVSKFYKFLLEFTLCLIFNQFSSNCASATL